jgi:Predicted signal transduction protein
MAIQSTRGTDAWIERINVQEMPALCATVRMLEKMAKDDNMSLADLGKSILHDHGLTTRILRVANSVTYNRGNTPVTTISRAVVLLGFNALKQICITAKLVDSLLKSHDISQMVYERLLRLMAQSFHAAMLAKMMLADYDEDTREEAYIAALLHNIGESTFWSMGGPITEQLDDKLRKAQGNENDIIRDMLGTTFNKISAGLANSWNMGSLLQLSLKDPDRRTPELQAIAEANQFSALLQDPKATPAQIEQQMNAMAKTMKIEPRILRQRVRQCGEETIKLAYTYGALMLSPYLDASLAPFLTAEKTVQQPNEPDDLIQLKTLRELTTLAYEKADINLIMQKSLHGIYQGVGMDRVAILMLNREKTQLQARFAAALDQSPLKEIFIIELEGGLRSIFHHCLQTHETVWIKSHTDLHWSHLLPATTKSISCAKGFFLSPIVLDKQSIGLFYADRATSGRPLTSEDFFSFTHFVQQTNLCLTNIMH